MPPTILDDGINVMGTSTPAPITPTIIAPADDTTVTDGDTVTFTGTAGPNAVIVIERQTTVTPSTWRTITMTQASPDGAWTATVTAGTTELPVGDQTIHAGVGTAESTPITLHVTEPTPPEE